MMTNNPYAAPQARLEDTESDGRAKSPKRVGITLLIMNILGLLSIVGTLYLLFFGIGDFAATMRAMGLGENYLYLSYGIGLLAGIWLVFIAIDLMKYRDKGRRHYNYYFLYMIASSVLGLIYQISVMPSDLSLFALLPSSIGVLLSLLLFFWFWWLLNSDKAKASLT